MTTKVKITRPTRPGLSKTDVPGVWRTADGIQCDEYGVALDFKSIKRKDDERFAEVTGAAPTNPAELLRAIALDPRNSLAIRMDAATKAAPYFNPKLVAMQGVAGGAPIAVANLGTLTKEQLTAYEALLTQAAAVIAGGQS